MEVWSPEQITQIKDFTPETIAYAHKVLQENVAAGIKIDNQFRYFLGVCKKHKLNPTTGMIKPWTRAKVGPQSVYHHADRVLESPHVFALNLEKRLHERRFELHPLAFRIPNPMFKVLSPQEIEECMAVHVDCECRKNVDYLDSHVQPISQKLTTQAQRHLETPETTERKYVIDFR